MKQTQSIMGMTITVAIEDREASEKDLGAVFAYFTAVDERFSTYKETSEISAINRGDIGLADVSPEMREVLAIAEQTKLETRSYFDIRRPDGSLDPSGIVKGWAIRNAARILDGRGFKNFYVNAGGDVEARGVNSEGRPWTAGIKNPFNQKEIVRALPLAGRGIATSGSYERGAHIYNPLAPEESLESVVSMTVVGPDVLEADRFATAAFAMGKDGIRFVEGLEGLEGYAIDAAGIATMTSGFERIALPLL